MKPNEKADLITNIATKRGFFFPTAEIYNGPAGFWTYGHLGTTMKQKWSDLWRCWFLGLHPNYMEIEGSSILPKKVFESSGHLKNFNDPLTHCKKCKFQFRADQLIEDETGASVEGFSPEDIDKEIAKHKLKCPRCGSELDKVKRFNMMFELKIGATGEETGYLSPETAQNPFLSFKRQFFALREKLPMGLAMIGKVYRNEVSPRQGFFRLREFTQAELQIFFDPATIDEHENWSNVKKEKLTILLHKDREKNKITEISAEELNAKLKIPKFYAYHLVKVQQFYLNQLKIPKEKFRFKELSPEERAFYNKIHFDMELDLETLGGFKEVGGVHYRTDHDLGGHQRGSGEKHEVTINGKSVVPHVLELSFGVDRNVWALLDIFFKQEKERTIFTFPLNLVPYDLALFPLLNKDGLPEEAEKVNEILKEQHWRLFYDNKASIGKMYRRIDEIGVPFAITVDHQTLKDKTVTLRETTSMKQIRLKIADLSTKIKEIFEGKLTFEKAGKTI